MAKPPDERIRSAFPTLDEETLSRWLADSAELDKEIWRLASRGGPQVIGKRAVVEALRAHSPFLHGPGLRQAVALTKYYAWHEGYDKSPDPLPLRVEDE